MSNRIRILDLFEGEKWPLWGETVNLPRLRDRVVCGTRVRYGSRQSFFLHDQIDDVRCRCEADRHLVEEEDASFCRGLD
jgi:hypothetical protein